MAILNGRDQCDLHAVLYKGVEVGEEEVQSIGLHQHHVSKSALSLYEHLFSITLTQRLSYSTSSEAYYNCKK